MAIKGKGHVPIIPVFLINRSFYYFIKFADTYRQRTGTNDTVILFSGYTRLENDKLKIAKKYLSKTFLKKIFMKKMFKKRSN